MIPALLPPRPRLRAASSRAPAPGAGDEPRAPLPPTASAVRAAHGAGAPGELRVLIVDDDFLFTEMLPRLLRKSVAHPSLQITAARSAEEAKRAARAQTFDLVLCDFDLRAAQNGLDVLGDISRVTPATFRILMSGHSAREIPPAPEGTVNAFLEKPMTLRDVVPQLATLLQERLGLTLERSPGGA